MTHHKGKRTRGFRSKLEAAVATRLKRLKLGYDYESKSYKYIIEKNYTPDFFLESGAILEVKGVLMPDDRVKMLCVKKQHPELNIIFLFMKPKAKVPRLKMTHAEWAEKNGFKWISAYDFKKRDLQ